MKVWGLPVGKKHWNKFVIKKKERKPILEEMNVKVILMGLRDDCIGYGKNFPKLCNSLLSQN